MPNQPGGAPYPLPTDPVANGALAITNLAQYVDRALVRGTRTAAQNVPTGTWTQITTWTRISQVGTDLNTATAGIICNRAGYVYMEAWGQFAVDSRGTVRGVAIGPAAGLTASVPAPLQPIMATRAMWLYTSLVLPVAAGDQLSMFAYQDAGVTITIGSNGLNAYMVA
jgi:hypothetical protein